MESSSLSGDHSGGNCDVDVGVSGFSQDIISVVGKKIYDAVRSTDLNAVATLLSSSTTEQAELSAPRREEGQIKEFLSTRHGEMNHTALMLAVRIGMEDMVQLLLHYQPPLEISDKVSSSSFAFFPPTNTTLSFFPLLAWIYGFTPCSCERRHRSHKSLN
jgi:hypothetical protein